MKPRNNIHALNSVSNTTTSQQQQQNPNTMLSFNMNTFTSSNNSSSPRGRHPASLNNPNAFNIQYLQQQQQQQAHLQGRIILPQSPSSLSSNNNQFQQQPQHFSASLNNPGFLDGTNTSMMGSQAVKPGHPISSLDLSNANVVDLSMQQVFCFSSSGTTNNNNMSNNNNNTSTATTNTCTSPKNTSTIMLMQQQQQPHANSLFQPMFNNQQQAMPSRGGSMINNNTHSLMQLGNNTNPSTMNNNTNNATNNTTEAMLRMLLQNPSMLLESSTFDLHVGSNINPSQQTTNFENLVPNMTDNHDIHTKDITVTNLLQQQCFDNGANTMNNDHFTFSDIFDIPLTTRSLSPTSSQQDGDSTSESTSTSSMEKMENDASDNKEEKKTSSKTRRRSDSGNQEEKKRKRSIKDRLMWSDELHQHFVQVVESLGVYEARPKEIKKIMNVDYLTTTHIKSHLQKYRSHLKKKAEQDGVQIPPLKRSVGSCSSLNKSKKEPKRKKKKIEKEDSNNSNTPSTNTPLPSASIQPSSTSNNANSSMTAPSSSTSATNNNTNQPQATSPPGSSQLFDPQYMSKLLSQLDKPMGNIQKVSPISIQPQVNIQNLPPSPKSSSTAPLIMQQRRNSQLSNNSNSNSQQLGLQVNTTMNAQNINFGNVQTLLTNSLNNFQRINDNSLGFVNNNFVTPMDPNIQFLQQNTTKKSNPALGEYLTILRNICSSEKEFADLFQNIQSQIREPRDMDLVVEGFRLGFLCGHRIKNNK